METKLGPETLKSAIIFYEANGEDKLMIDNWQQTFNLNKETKIMFDGKLFLKNEIYEVNGSTINQFGQIFLNGEIRANLTEKRSKKPDTEFFQFLSAGRFQSDGKS